MIELEEEKEEKPKVSKQEQGFINAYGPNWREVLGYDDHTAKVALDDKGAPGSLLGDAVTLGLSAWAVKNPLKAVEAIGTDPEDLPLELVAQKASLNPGNLTLGKVKRLKTGVSRILDTTQTVLFGRKPVFEFATVNIDDGLLKSVTKSITETGFKSNNIFASITRRTRESDTYIDWTNRGKEWLESHRGKDNPMTGYEHFVDPDTGITYRKGYSSSKDVIQNINMDLRAIRDAKRTKKTLIPRKEVVKIMEKYNQPPEMVDAFMKFQKAGKKKVDATIKKINDRIKAARKIDPNAYPGVKASLGHGRAADRYEHSADMLSNIDLENFFINVKRSNLDEVSDLFNRGLGRSLDLDEEVLKFLDKDLSKLFGGYGLHRTQIDASIKYVRQNMGNDIDWASHVTDTGEQLFKSKEEFLINEALQNAQKIE